MTTRTLPAGVGPIGFVATAVLCAISLGLLVITLTVLLVDTLRPTSGVAIADSSFYLLVTGTFAGILLAVYVCWRQLAPIESTYRRGALSIVCAFATVLTMLICIPIHQLFGRAGLLGLLVLSSILSGILVHRARRLGGLVG